MSTKRNHRAFRIPKAIRIRRFLFHQSVVAVGALLCALAYALFQVPFKIAAGGISGIGIIVNHYTGWSVGLLFLLMNIPLLFIGFRYLGGKRFLVSTVFSVFLFSIGADLFTHYLPLWLERFPLSDDALLNAIYAGMIYGVGSGLIYRAGGTMGGTSVPARIIQKFTGFALSQSYLFTDLGIIVAAGFVFSWEQSMLALLTLILGGIVGDFVLEGSSQVRTAMIVTEKPGILSRALMQELRRGVSSWPITGAYTETTHTMIYCSVRRSQIYDLRYVVSQVDPDAFLVVGMAQSAWGGTGFNRLKRQEEER